MGRREGERPSALVGSGCQITLGHFALLCLTFVLCEMGCSEEEMSSCLGTLVLLRLLECEQGPPWAFSKLLPWQH